MKLRKLRIAWSVFWGLACVLLCLLWAISYWWISSLGLRLSSTAEAMVVSIQGCMYWGTLPSEDWNWNVHIEPLPNNNQLVTNVRSSGSNVETYVVIRKTDWASDLNAELDWRGRFGFGLSHSPDLQFVSFPHWFAILLLAMLATVPWIRQL